MNWIFIGFALIALIFLIIRAVRKKKEGEEIIEVPMIPAHITALNALHALEKQEAWKSEDKKRYYSDLTDTVRLYLEQRFQIFAMEQTTREIIDDLKYSDITNEDKEFLRKILTQADMVKFARVKPDNELGYVSLGRSIEFVDKTKKEEENDKGGLDNESSVALAKEDEE